MTCLFCDQHDKAKNRVIAENGLAFARWDNFPAAPGHAEIVPKRHVISVFDLTDSEVLAMYALLREMRDVFEIFPGCKEPDGYTIGFNEGEAAGRTVHHAHLHIIPRHAGDVPNPRGGIRNIIPGKGDY